MSEDISRLSAAFADRMRELGAGPNDPRLAPMAAQLQALFRQHVTAASNGITASVPATEYAFQLPPALTDLLRAYLATCPAQAFVQAPALSDSDAGRKLLELPAADRVRMVVAAYHAWSSNRWGGSSGGGLRRVVSDLLRAKLPLTDADAIALAELGVRDGFTYASYSPNQAILGALERHVAANGLSVGLRRTLERLRGEMNKQGAGNNVQGRKLRSGVEALLEHQDAAPVRPPATPSRCSSRRATNGAPRS